MKQAVADQIVDNENPFEKKSCYDCAHLTGYVNIWCSDNEATEARGTAIPGVIHCDFWKPHYGRLSKEDRKRMKEYGYEEPSFTGKIIHIIDGKLF